MQKPRDILFAFFGTSELSVFALDALERHGFLPALVVTSPDKPRGRGLELSPSPAKEWAQKRGIDCIAPATLKGDLPPELLNTEWDVFIVAAYPKLLPKALLDIPRRACLNIHPSLLPKFRGPSPVLSAMLADERETGVSVMRMAEAMDAGPVIAQARIEIDEADWPPKGSVLSEMLFTEGGNLLAEVLPEWLAGKLPAEPQNEASATYTKKFGSEDACIDLSGDARQNFLKIRAFDAGPRAHFFADAKNGQKMRVIIADAAFENGALKVLRVVPEGKKEMGWDEFARTYRASPAENPSL